MGSASGEAPPSVRRGRDDRRYGTAELGPWAAVGHGTPDLDQRFWPLDVAAQPKMARDVDHRQLASSTGGPRPESSAHPLATGAVTGQSIGARKNPDSSD